jgi:hypothetical protein
MSTIPINSKIKVLYLVFINISNKETKKRASEIIIGKKYLQPSL